MVEISFLMLPSGRSSWPVTAVTVTRRVMSVPELVMNSLLPLMTQAFSSPTTSRRAVVLVHPAQLLEGERQGEVVPAHAAELLREGQAEQSHVRHLGNNFVGEAVFLIVLGGDRSHHFVGEFADGVAEVLVFLAEFKICHRGLLLSDVGLWSVAVAVA